MTEPRKILQITSYPPPRAGWGMRVQFLKQHLERTGHRCVVLNIGRSRAVPSPEYETVLGGADYFRKVWRFSRQGFVTHVHVNGASPKGFVLTLTAELINLVWGRRPVLTFHAGANQTYFPRPKYPLLLPMFWLLFTIPRRIICNSEDVKAKIREYGVAADKIVPIPAFSPQYLESERVALSGRIEGFYERFADVLFSYINIRPVFYPLVLIEAFAALARRRREVGLVLCGISGYQEEGLWGKVCALVERHGLKDRILIVEDLDHAQFLTAMSRATVYVRTHISDGVCSSVLEAMSLGVPVVAADNGTRPAGVVTYSASDPVDLEARLDMVLDSRDAVAAALVKPTVRDTLSEEAALLTV